MISTFERIENEVSVVFGFNDFDQLYECGTKDDVYEAMKEVAVRYAAVKCHEQRNNDAISAHKAFKEQFSVDGIVRTSTNIIETILSNPLATEK